MYKCKTEAKRIPPESEKKHKFLLSLHKVGMKLIYVQTVNLNGFFKPRFHNVLNFQIIFCLTKQLPNSDLQVTKKKTTTTTNQYNMPSLTVAANFFEVDF